MNDNFEFSRFGKLLTYECRNYVPRFVVALIVFVCIVFSVWLTSAIFNFSVNTSVRTVILNFILGISYFAAPFIVYYNMNDRKRGYSYAMLPASTLEKFASMFIICMVVLPMISYLTLAASDLFFYLVSSMGVGGFYGIAVFNPLAVECPHEFGTLSLVVTYMISIAVPMMFNTVFRTAKVVKTILVDMAASFLLSIVFFLIALNVSEETLEVLGNIAFGFCIEGVINFWLVIFLVIPLVVTYFRIKRVNY